MKHKPKSAHFTKYGFSSEHDAALDLCVARFGMCEFGCAKDGALNCYFHASRRECKPSVDTQPHPAPLAQPAESEAQG